MRISDWSLVGVMMFIALIFLTAVGWVWNIVKLVDTDFALNAGMFVVRVIGIFFAPLGAILGYL